LALRALPPAKTGTVDFADAPRRAFVVTLQLATVGATSVAILAVTQPFVSAARGGELLLLLLVILGVIFWRSATNLQGHARAGAEVIVAALMQQMAPASDAHEPSPPPDALEQLRTTLPGLGEPIRLHITDDSPAVGQTLAKLNLRGLTGATVLAITRRDERIVLPVGKEILHAGDTLALAGTHDAVSAAMALLRPV
jgi:CPA2 family monovalent cation:H+ antiporter-2